MPTRLLIAYSLIALSAAVILYFVIVMLRRRRRAAHAPHRFGRHRGN